MPLVAAIPSRTTQNPLFPVDLADLLLRHMRDSSENHKRETLELREMAGSASIGESL